MAEARNFPSWLWLIGSYLGLLMATAVILLWMGRVPMCECGYIKLWHGATLSSENSQHISDWYSLSHVIHGFGFYWLLWYFARKYSVQTRSLLALLIEIGWELLENSPMIINRYRAETISLNYYGDSVINASFDIIAMLIGFWLARRFPVLLSILVIIVLESIALYFIRDNLILNIMMLLYPLDSIKTWQGGIS